IWKATVTSEAGWTQTFTFLRVSPALIWSPNERPAAYSGTVQVDALETGELPAADLTTDSSQQPMADAAPTGAGSDLVADVLNLLATPVTSADLPPPPAETPSQEPLGAQFVTWLRQGIATRRIKINEPQALVHTVAGTAFLVSPGIFQRYI